MFKHTRRGVFPLAAAAVTAAIPATGYVARGGVSDEQFVSSLQFVHPQGGLAARQALAAGMKPQELFAVLMPGENPALGEPALLFQHEGRSRAFLPTGERRNG